LLIRNIFPIFALSKNWLKALLGGRRQGKGHIYIKT